MNKNNLDQQTEQAPSSTRDGFGKGLVLAAERDERIVGLCADLTESTRMQEFAERFPERFFQVGVAEQNLIGVAAGLALEGLKPVAASYACFSPANSWGVIRTSVCYSNAPVVIVGGHAGFATGEDGATHQSLEDIATMRVLPNMTVVVPADAAQATTLTQEALSLDTPVYIRTSKNVVNNFTTGAMETSIGKAQMLRAGEDLTIVGCGSILERALLAAVELEAYHGISVRVLNMHTIKPLDTSALKHATKETSAILTLEDHQKTGGLGSAVAEYIAQQNDRPLMRMLGADDTFGESGKGEDVLDAYGLSIHAVVSAAIDLYRQVRS